MSENERCSCSRPIIHYHQKSETKYRSSQVWSYATQPRLFPTMINVLSNWLFVPKMLLCYLLTAAAGHSTECLKNWVHVLWTYSSMMSTLPTSHPESMWVDIILLSRSTLMTEDHGKSTIQIQVSHSLLRNESCSWSRPWINHYHQKSYPKYRRLQLCSREAEPQIIPTLKKNYSLKFGYLNPKNATGYCTKC